VRLVVAGTPQVAVPTLTALADSPHEVVAVLTRPDPRAGRGRRSTRSPVAQWADEHGVDVLQPQRPGDPEFLAQLADLRIDCCPVVAYGALLPPSALVVPRHGWVNLHFSLLPAWRGAAPVQHAIMAGDEITGASAFLIEAGLDTGPVYGVLTERIRDRDTAGELLGRLAEAGAALLLATLDGIEAGVLQAVPQPGDGVSLAPKIEVAQAQLDWTAPTVRLDRLVRGCTPDPGAWTTLRGERLGVDVVEPHSEPVVPAVAPGELVVQRRAVLVGTGDGAVRLTTVRPAGRRAMSALDWARGARPTPGERLT
jgi:methionyl-tRNA formyltransferase